MRHLRAAALGVHAQRVLRQHRVEVGELDEARRRERRLVGLALHPAQADVALVAAGGGEPVRYAGILVRDDDAHRAVALGRRLAAVHAGHVVAVVNRGHPVVVQLKLPVVALRRRELDQQRLVRLHHPVHVVDDAAGRRADRALRGRAAEGVRLLAVALLPLAPVVGRVPDPVRRSGEALGHPLGRHRLRRPVVADALDQHVDRRLGGPVAEELADGEAVHVGHRAKPVPGVLIRADDDLEAAVPVGDEVLAHDPPYLGGLTRRRRLDRAVGAEHQVVHAAAVAGDAVGLGAVDVGAQVDAVRVVPAVLARRRHRPEEIRVERVGVLDVDVEPERDVLREVLEAPRAVERRRGRGIIEDVRPRCLEVVAEALPGLLQHRVVLGVSVRHRIPPLVHREHSEASRGCELLT